MTMKKVIIQSSYGGLTLQQEFLNKVKEFGHEHIFTIDARMDERIIDLVEAGSVTVNDWEHLSVEEVDTSRLWSIGEYDGAESILYIE